MHCLKELVAYGSLDLPEVKLDNGGLMYFKPTCVGTVCSRKFSVQNVSRLPISFEWKLKHSDAQVVDVQPPIGIIQPNEIQVCYSVMYFNDKDYSTQLLTSPDLIILKCSNAL